MACNIKRLGNEVVSVITDNGSESVVFNKLVTSPLINNSEDALNIYKGALQKGLIESYVPADLRLVDETTMEPRVFYRSNGVIYSSLRSALQNSNPTSIEFGIIESEFKGSIVDAKTDKEFDFPQGELTIRTSNLGLEMKLFNDDAFKSLGKVVLDNISTPNGIIQEAVRTNLLAEEKLFIDGRFRLVGEGNDNNSRKGNLMGVTYTLQMNPVAHNIETGGFRYLSYDMHDINIANVGTSTMSIDEFSEKSYNNDSEVINDVNYLSNLHKKALRSGFMYRPISSNNSDIKPLDRKQLNELIIKSLTDLGVSRQSIEEFRKKTQTKHGKQISIDGFADISNKVYGFLDGNNTVLTEEASHFFIEAMNGTQQLSEAMDAVTDTKEYVEVVNNYTDIYSDIYESKEELDHALRKEALGKLLTNHLLELSNNSSNTSLFSNISNILDSVIDYIKSAFGFTNETKAYQTINRLNSEVEKYLYSERMSELKDNIGNKLSPIDVLYNVDTISSTKKSMINKLIELRGKLGSLPGDSMEFNPITTEQIENRAWASAIGLIGIAEVEAKRLKLEVVAAMSNGTVESAEVRNAYIQLKQHIMPLINEISSYINKGETNDSLTHDEHIELKRALNGVRNNFGELEGVLTKINSEEYFRKTVFDQLQKNMNWNDSEIESFIKQVYAEQKDVNVLMAKIGSMAHRSVPLLTLASKVVADISSKTSNDIVRNSLEKIDNFIKEGHHKIIQDLIVKDSDGKRTEMLRHAFRLTELNKARESKERTVKANILQLTDKQLSTTQNIDRIARNILVVGIKNSSITNEVLINNMGEGVIYLTQDDFNNFKHDIQPTLDRITELVGKSISFDDIIRPTKLENQYAIFNRTIDGLGTAITDSINKDPMNMSSLQLAEFHQQMSQYRAETQEQYFKEEYYRKEQEWIDSIKESMGEPSSKAFIRGLMARKELNSRLAKVRSRHLRPDGRPDMVSLHKNPSDSLEYAEVSRKLREYENVLDNNGNFLDAYYKEVDGKVIAKPLTEEALEGMTDAEMIGWGMIKLREFWGDTKFDVDNSFVDIVEELAKENYIEAFQFLKYNGNIGFSQEYYDKLTDEPSYIDKVRTQISLEEDPEIKSELEYELQEYENTYKHIKSLKRIHRSIKHTAEFDFTGDDYAKRQLLALENRLIEMRRRLPKVEGRAVLESETTMSNSYFEELKSEGIKEGTIAEAEFLESHIPQTMLEDYHAFSIAMRKYVENYKPYHEKYSKYVDSARAKGGDLLQNSKIEYLRAHSASYFRKTTPKGFDSFIKELEEGKLNPSILLTKEGVPDSYKNIVNMLEVRPRNGWISDIFNEENINHKYNPNGENVQYKRKVENLDSEFFKFFGISPDEYLDSNKEVHELTPTQNKKHFEALVQYTSLRKQSLEQKGLEKQISSFRIPRKRRESMERFVRFWDNPIDVIKNVYRDLSTYRVDDLDQPTVTKDEAKAMLGDIKKIPVYYERPLESPSDQSYDLTGILMADIQQAYLYKNRREAESTIMSIVNHMSHLNFIDNIKPESSNAMAMLKEYIDANLYNRTVNANFDFQIGGRMFRLSKLFTALNRMFSHSNLMFNPFVDFTGATTSKIARFLNKKSNEYFAADSYDWAQKESKKQLANYLSESGNLVKSSQLVRMLESIGVDSPGERIQNTIFGKGLRLAEKSPYGGSKISNMTNTAPLVYTYLKDHRLLNGKFINFQEFMRLSENNGKDLKELSEDWKKYKDQSLIELADFNYGIHFKEGVEVADGEVDRLQLSLRSKLMHVLEQTEGVIASENRTWLQRNPLLSLMMTHKGWFTIALDRRFKGKQQNLYSNKEEVGHYREVMSMIYEAYKEAGTANPIEILKKLKEIHNAKDPTDPGKSALQYFKWESALTAILTMLAVGVIGYTGDDDNKDVWPAQFAGLIYLRTISELNSISWFGIPGSVKDTFQKPFVSADFFSELTNLNDFSFDPVKHGKFEGIPKIGRKISKLTPLKRIFDLNDPARTLETYRTFNANTLLGLEPDGMADWILEQVNEGE